jgi:hypothetical protein
MRRDWSIESVIERLKREGSQWYLTQHATKLAKSKGANVTESNPSLAIAPDRLRWRCEPLYVDVECSHAVLELIQDGAVDGHGSLAHCDLETGGILFGEWTDTSIRIEAARALECEHKFGPSFQLSRKDEASLLEALAVARKDPELGQLQPIGLYMSKSQKFSVAVADPRIFDRYFPKARPMALILRPSKFGQTRAGFFLRERGSVTYFGANQVSSSTSESAHRVRQPMAENAQDDDRPENQVARPEDVATVTAPPPNEAIGAWSRESVRRLITSPLKRFRASLLTGEKLWNVSRWDLVAAIVLLGFCIATTRTLWVRSNLELSTRIPMRITDTGSQLRIDWDAHQEPILSATNGVLEIRDGETEPVHLPFARDALLAGSVLYAPRSGTIQVRMRLMNHKKPLQESVIYYIKPERIPPSVPIVVFSPATSKSGPPLVAESPLPINPVLKEEPHLADAVLQQRGNENRGMKNAARPANRSRVSRVFRLPPLRPLVATNSRIRVDLLDAPDLRINQSFPQALLLPNGAMLTGSAIRARPSRGRLIWTGELQKNEFISFSASGSSRGVLNGRLPGFPIQVNIQPGEVVDGGIAILTNDVSRAGVNEPAHARNGWDVVIYKWVQKPIPELRVVEPPGPSNNWDRIVLHNTDRNLSVVVVDWQSMDKSKPAD